MSVAANAIMKFDDIEKLHDLLDAAKKRLANLTDLSFAAAVERDQVILVLAEAQALLPERPAPPPYLPRSTWA